MVSDHWSASYTFIMTTIQPCSSANHTSLFAFQHLAMVSMMTRLVKIILITRLVKILMTRLVKILDIGPHLAHWSSSSLAPSITHTLLFNSFDDSDDIGDDDYWLLMIVTAPNLDHFLCWWSSCSLDHQSNMLFSPVLTLLCSPVSDLNDDRSSEKPLIQEPCIIILFFSIRIIIMVCKIITNFVSVYLSNSLIDGDSDTFSDVIT